MSLPDAQRAIRERVALSEDGVTAMLVMRGDDAHDALLALCPSRLFLRDGQVRESLLLDREGAPLADVLVCADDEDVLLLVEGLDAAGLRAHIEAHLPDGLQPELEDWSESRRLLTLSGPWAWELTAEVFGPDMVALPYLNFFRVDEGLCVRAGKTGEFGFHLVVAADAADEMKARLLEVGAAWDLAEVTPAELAHARFEAWFFDPAHVPEGTTPLELALSWRLDRGRPWVGSAAIEVRRSSGVTRRLCAAVCASPLSAGDPVYFEQRAIGEVVRSAFSPACEEHVVSLLLEERFAHGGVRRYSVQREGERHPITTVAPPLLNNRSLYVDPRRHSYREVDEVAFPPLAPPPRAPR